MKRSTITALAAIGIIQSTMTESFGGYTFVTNDNSRITFTSWDGVPDTDYGYPGQIIAVRIPATTNGFPVTDIGTIFSPAGAGSAVTHVEGMANVKEIAAGAFMNCASLVTGEFASVTNVGDYAFSGCVNMNELYVPNIVRIGDYAFEGCKIWAPTFGNNVKWIGDYAFRDCAEMYDFGFSPGVMHVGIGVFSGCLSIKGIQDGVTFLGNLPYCTESMFEYSGIENLVFPAHWTELPATAFQCCVNLTNAVLHSGITAVGSEVFYNTPNLASMTFANNATVSAAAYFWSEVPESYVRRVLFTSGVTAISDGAFYGWPRLESVTFPTNAMTVGVTAFSNCSALSSVSNLCNKTLGEEAFSYSGLINVTLPASCTPGYYLFSGCASLTNAVLEDGATNLPSGLFASCSSLKSVRLPEGVTTLPSEAFYGCASLDAMIIPSSVRVFADYCLSGCSSYLAAIYLGPERTAGYSAFAGTAAGSKVYYFLGEDAPDTGIPAVQIPVRFPAASDVTEGVAFGVNAVGTHKCVTRPSGGTVIMLVDGTMRETASGSAVLRVLP